MNYLNLARRVARESGTVDGTFIPGNVAGQSGRLLKIVEWTEQAWTNIQLERLWSFRRREFSSTVLVGTERYTPSALGMTDFSAWVRDAPDTGSYPVTLYTAVADEAALPEIPFDYYKRVYERGTQTPARPQYYAISPTSELCVGPVPDASYTIKGEYYRDAQVLAANGDTPYIDDDYHHAIVALALVYLCEHDGAQQELITWNNRWRQWRARMIERFQPQIECRAHPLA